MDEEKKDNFSRLGSEINNKPRPFNIRKIYVTICFCTDRWGFRMDGEEGSLDKVRCEVREDGQRRDRDEDNRWN